MDFNEVRVWKIGSRWGNMGPSVLDLFLDYGVVFFNDDGTQVGDWRAVRQNDLFIISDGTVPVAVGQALGSFCSYDALGIQFRRADLEKVIIDGVELCNLKLCRAKILLIEENQRNEDWAINPQYRFCAANNAADMVRNYWRQCFEHSDKFEIKTSVMPLFNREANGEKCIFSSDVRYLIPIYQRPYSWGENELRRLMEDLHQGLTQNEQIFLGTFQLSQPIPLCPNGNTKAYQVIDGQQRITTFMLLWSLLEKICGQRQMMLDFMHNNFRTSVNKRSAQNDFDDLLTYMDNAPNGLNEFRNYIINDSNTSSAQQNKYILNLKILYNILTEFASGELQNDDDDTTLKSLFYYAKAFIRQKITVVVIETHAGLSKTLKIFDTINSSGLDLGSEDIFKLRLYEYLKRNGEDDNVFDRISEVYEKVNEYNRHPSAGCPLKMEDILLTYQRLLIAKYSLNASTFSMAYETFFNQLFDTLLSIHSYENFLHLPNVFILTVDELNNIVDMHIKYYTMCEKDADLKIWWTMFWETRYGGISWNFPVLALIRGLPTNNVKKFTKDLVKVLVAPTLYFGRRVYQGQSYLLDLLKSIWNGEFNIINDSVLTWCSEKWNFKNHILSEMLSEALEYEIAGTPKWKNLLCVLVEYIKSEDKDDDLFKRLFETGFDIDHIQPYTDEQNPEQVWQQWDGEINKLGNLVMLESTLNRSVQNHQNVKPDAYMRSQYHSVQELQAKVSNWTQNMAINRKTELIHDIITLLTTED